MTDRLPWSEALRLADMEKRARVSQKVRTEFPLLSITEQKIMVEKYVRGEAPELSSIFVAERELAEKRRRLGPE